MSAVSSVSEFVGAVAQAAGAAHNVAQGNVSGTLNSVDTVATVFGSALTAAQQIATWANRPAAALGLGNAGVFANAIAFGTAKQQYEAAVASGDSRAAWSAATGMIAAGAGVIAGLPLPPQIRLPAVAINLTYTALKEWIANGNDIRDGFNTAWSDLKTALGDAWRAFVDASGSYAHLWVAEGWLPWIGDGAQQFYDSALRFVFVRDPLVLDLDGDGLELTAATGQVLFDHNADGIRTGTGWVAGDDGLLVLDRNGNGTIDSGRELFGVDTVKSNGQFAREGFDALRDLDANGDGVFNASDAAFAQVRVWRDLDQDEVDLAGLTARSAWAHAGGSCAGARHLRCH